MPYSSRVPQLLLGLLLAGGFNGSALAEKPCTAPPGQLCWEVHYPTITPQSMRLSLLSALVMGAQGVDGWLPATASWQTDFTDSCRSKSEAVRLAGVHTRLKWFDLLDTKVSSDYKECNPEGAARHMQNVTGHEWIWRSYTRGEADKADNLTVQVLKQLEAPVIIPYFGQWDHWLTIVQVTARMLSASEYEVTGAVFYDGLLGSDLAGFGKLLGARMSPRVVVDSISFARSYTHIMSAPMADCNTAALPADRCDVLFGDSWYNRFVSIYDPPPGAPSPAALASTGKTTFAVTPGTLRPGEHMTAGLARSRAFEAARVAGKDVDPALAAALREGQPDEAVHVAGYWPSGDPWNYYLVPVRDATNRLSALIQLSAQDGAFEATAVLPQSIPFAPLSLDQARSIASRELRRSETLDNGQLTWNPRPYVAGARSPFVPYYEFKVQNTSTSVPQEVVRVIWHTGKLAGRAPAGLP